MLIDEFWLPTEKGKDGWDSVDVNDRGQLADH
jgi:hypothetical protein